MKKIFKSFIAITLLMTNVMSVSATEVEELQEVVEIIEIESNDEEIPDTNESLEVVSLDDVLSLVPDTVKIDMTEIDGLVWLGTYTTKPNDWDMDLGDTNIYTRLYAYASEVQTEVEKLLDTSKYSVSVYSHHGVFGVYSRLNIHELYVTIKDLETGTSETKLVEVEYKNTSNFNDTDYNIAKNVFTVMNDLLKVDDKYYTYGISPKDYEMNNTSYFDKYMSSQVKTVRVLIDSIMGDDYECIFIFVDGVAYATYTLTVGSEGYLSVPSTNTTENFAYLKSLEINQLNTLLEDQFDTAWMGEEFVPFTDLVSIEKISDTYTHLSLLDSYLGTFTLTDSNGTSQDIVLLCEVADGNADTETEPEVEKNEITDGVYLEDDYEGVVITSSDLDVNSATYIEMNDYLTQLGFGYVLNAYEFTLESGDISNGIKISFDVGVQYNGKYAMVLHKKQNDEFEEFKLMVSNGTITIEVDELSPFVVAVEEFVELTTPQTSDNTFILFNSCILLLAFSMLSIKKSVTSK